MEVRQAGTDAGSRSFHQWRTTPVTPKLGGVKVARGVRRERISPFP